VDVFRHHDISHDHEAVTLASFFQDGEEAVAAPCGAQKSQGAVTRTGDEVQVVGVVVAVQAAGHDKLTLSAASCPPIAKYAKDGAPSFRFGKEINGGRVGHRAAKPTHRKVRDRRATGRRSALLYNFGVHLTLWNSQEMGVRFDDECSFRLRSFND